MIAGSAPVTSNQALLLEGEDIFRPACDQKNLAAEMLVDMFLRLANCYEWKGRPDKAERQLSVCAKVIEALSEDTPPENRKRTFYGDYGRQALEQIRRWKEAGRTPRPSL